MPLVENPYDKYCIGKLQAENTAIKAELKNARETYDEFALADKKEIERLKGLMPSEADRFHLGRCKIRCCPVCDAVLLKYQEQLWQCWHCRPDRGKE